uniref:Uncharacterized protein n=1 Tax=Chelonoidis abingdonii TaxID=106734 RepID=A0A8C0HDY5_CHEAB
LLTELYYVAGNGQVLSCGSNSFGQLGVPQTSGGCLIPQKIESLTEKVVNVAAGLRHALAATGEYAIINLTFQPEIKTTFIM